MTLAIGVAVVVSVVALLDPGSAAGARVPIVTCGVLGFLCDDAFAGRGLARNLFTCRHVSLIANDRIGVALDALGVLHIADVADRVAQVRVLREAVGVSLTLAQVLSAAADSGCADVSASAVVLIVAQGSVADRFMAASRRADLVDALYGAGVRGAFVVVIAVLKWIRDTVSTRARVGRALVRHLLVTELSVRGGDHDAGPTVTAGPLFTRSRALRFTDAEGRRRCRCTAALDATCDLAGAQLDALVSALAIIAASERFVGRTCGLGDDDIRRRDASRGVRRIIIAAARGELRVQRGGG